MSSMQVLCLWMGTTGVPCALVLPVSSPPGEQEEKKMVGKEFLSTTFIIPVVKEKKKTIKISQNTLKNFKFPT